MKTDGAVSNIDITQELLLARKLASFCALDVIQK